MVMPLYRGVTLKDRLRQMSVPPSEAWLLGLLRQLLDALEIIHRENCFHRDISPDNILLIENDRPVLLDFGAARRVIGDLTQTLTVILKPGYAPVEQYAEVPSMKQGAWTDIYALAAVAYFAVTGRPPEPSISRLMHDTMRPLADTLRGRYSEAFLAAIDVALKVRPGDRPQDAAALRALLNAPRPAAPAVAAAKIQAPAQPVAAPSSGGTPPSKPAIPQAPVVAPRARRPYVAATVVGTLVAGAAAALYALLYRSELPPPVVPAPAARPAADAPPQSAPSLPPAATVDNAAAELASRLAIAPATPAPTQPPATEPLQPSRPSSAPRSRAQSQTPPQRAQTQNSAAPAVKPANAGTSAPPSAPQSSLAQGDSRRAKKLRQMIAEAERYQLLGDSRRAKKMAERALKLDPGNADALAIIRRAR